MRKGGARNYAFPLIFLFHFPTFSTFSFLGVCLCVCVYLRMYVRAYLAIPCVSANDNFKHVKTNIRYIFYEIIVKWNKCEICKNSCI